MSEPLTREERDEPLMPDGGGSCSCDFCTREARYEATVRAVEAERDRYRERVERLRGVIAISIAVLPENGELAEKYLLAGESADRDALADLEARVKRAPA